MKTQCNLKAIPAQGWRDGDRKFVEMFVRLFTLTLMMQLWQAQSRYHNSCVSAPDSVLEQVTEPQCAPDVQLSCHQCVKVCALVFEKSMMFSFVETH